MYKIAVAANLTYIATVARQIDRNISNQKISSLCYPHSGTSSGVYILPKIF